MNVFTPPPGLANPHLQTLLPRLLRRKPVLQPFWEELELPDGDFVELAWSDKWSQMASGTPVLVIFHGLEGSFYSPYANGLMQAFAARGWLAVTMHFRGCGRRPNRLARAYHSGEIEDARFFLTTLRDRLPKASIVAAGFSLGGNMLARYLAHYVSEPIVHSAAIVSAPFDLVSCSSKLEKGFSVIYGRYLLRSLKKKMLEKFALLEKEINISRESVRDIRTIREFDDCITAPLYGFKDVTDYYTRCSALPVLNEIQNPTLIIQAEDDPFMSRKVILTWPLSANIDYRLSGHGGHVGFLCGGKNGIGFWLEEFLPDYYNDMLC